MAETIIWSVGLTFIGACCIAAIWEHWSLSRQMKATLNEHLSSPSNTQATKTPLPPTPK